MGFLFVFLFKGVSDVARFLWDNTSVVTLVHVWTEAAPMLQLWPSGGGQGRGQRDTMSMHGRFFKNKKKKSSSESC